MAVHVRRDRPDGSKTLFWERPDGTGGLGGVPAASLPLYGSELLRDWPHGVAVVLVEGEKTADALRSADIPAVATVTGASGTPDMASLAVLAGRDVVLWPDADAPGVSHMERIAATLQGVARTVRRFDWHDAPPKGDAADFLKLHTNDADGLRDRLAAAPAWGAETHSAASTGVPAGGGSGGDRRERGPSVATRLVQMVEASGAQLWHSPDGEGYATVPAGNHRETWALKSGGYRRWLARLFYEAGGGGGVANAQAVADALGVLSAQAVFDGPEYTPAVRVAGHDGAIYLDLCNPGWEAVEVTADGWRVLASSELPDGVRFVRHGGMLALAEPPITGGDVEALRPFVNVGSDDDLRLVVAWLLATLSPTGPYPVLALHGQQGSSKTTVARVLRSLVDPSASPVRSEPRNVDDLLIAASHSRVVCYDNLSAVPTWLSDGLCRLATGGGLSKRTLYSDSEETIIEAVRPVVLTGITELATRADLLDRSIVLELQPIAEQHRRPEAEFWREFEAARPRILGGLLDAVAGVLRELPSTHLARLPRMADFALWATAAETPLGWESGAFMAAYAGNRDAANDLALDASPVAAAVRGLAAEYAQDGGWAGSASDLLTTLTNRLRLPVGKPEPKGWPANGRALSNALRRIAPNLRAAGVDVEFATPHGKRLIVIRQEPEISVPSVPTVPVVESVPEPTAERNANPGHRRGVSGTAERTERWERKSTGLFT